jgi:uncharacterized repeat protein (TIGR03806 family)
MLRVANRTALALAVAGAAATLALAQAPVGVNDAAITGDALPAALSEYRFFTDLKARTPNPRLFGYVLNTPLFSDYAEKQRYLYVPAGQAAAYDSDGVLRLPVGSAIVKTFGYAQSGTFRPLETRLLLHRASGWVALPYVWNADLSDAVLRRGGTRIPVSFTDPAGRARTISYAVPNQNQCKGCHDLAGQITPIGPTARNLNRDGQLQRLNAAEMIDRLPDRVPELARWDDTSATLDARAAAYLEVNCAHCHNPRGPASNSGLWLDHGQPDPVARGLRKHPVAAGRGSGNRDYDIDPGNPENSILLYRMASTDPGVAMPELGRATAHDEALALLTEWIKAMPASDSQVKQPGR